MKNFLNHWQYGVKARVVDGALLVRFDTAIEPALLRLDLGRVQANTVQVRAHEGDYQLGLSGYRMEFIPLASFESRAAADTALHCVECALYRGQTPSRFRSVFMATVAIMLGLALVFALLGAVFGLSGMSGGNMMSPMASSSTHTDNAALQQAMQSLQQAGGLPQVPGITAPASGAAETGEPMSADDYLRQAAPGNQ